VSAAWTIVAPPGQIAAEPETVAVGFGSTLTVTDGALFETQPFASVTVSVYVVVDAGAAAGAQLDGFDSPAAGVQEHDTPPEPESGVDAPAQISAEPPAAAVGRGFTVTSALPDAVPAQLASDTAVTVYVVVPAGETERVAGEEATPDWTTPSDQVTVHGPVPVSAAWMPAAPPPAHTVPPPETEAVGSGRTTAVVVPAAEAQPLTVTVTL